MKPEEFVEKWVRGHQMAPHLLLVGRTGSGKTTAARYIVDYVCVRKRLASARVLDWDGEYAGLLPLPVYSPPFELPVPPLPQPSLSPPLADALAEVERAEEGGHMVAYFLLQQREPSLKRIARSLSALAASAPALRGVLEAAALRAEVISKYCVEDAAPEPDAELQEGIYLLSAIQSIWERASVQQFLASYYVISKRDPTPSLLVIEEGGMGARTTFLRHLLAHARRRGVRVIFVTQGPLPPPELRQNFEILLFDADPALRHELRVAVPDRPLAVGECWWIGRGRRPVLFRFSSARLR
jgi:DNA polymerase III delta prime subunit